MSRICRNKKKHTHHRHKSLKGAQPAASDATHPTVGISRGSLRAPMTHVAVSLASMMLAGGTAMAQQAGTDLPTIQVEGQGGDTGYQATGTGISRIPTPLIDTPQTVNVVTQQLIQDQQATTMEQALRNVPGITFSAGEGGNQGDTPFIRGFSARGDMFRDGIRDPGWYTRDLFSIQNVEVFKGPSAFAFGRGATGGAINLSSKLPTIAVPFIEGTITGYSPFGYRGELDAGGRTGNFTGRVQAMGQDIDTAGRDNVWTKRWGVAPSFTYDFTPQTRASFSYLYQGEESVPDYGHPYLPASTYDQNTGQYTGGYNGPGVPVGPVPVSRRNWYGFNSGPLRDIVRTDTHILTGKIEHNFTNDIKLANTTRYMVVDRFVRTTAPRSLVTTKPNPNDPTRPIPLPIDQWTIGRQHFQNQTDNTLIVNQTDLNAKFDTWGLKHTFSGGIEIAQENRTNQRANLCGPTVCRTNVVDPTPQPDLTPVIWQPEQKTTADTFAVYASDQIKINRYFEVMGAIRYDNFSTDYKATDTATLLPINLSRTDNLLSYRVGGVVHPTENSSIYVAYGISYNPTAEFLTLSTSGSSNVNLDPEKNETIEVGAKVDLWGDRLSLTGSIFQIEKTNMRISSDPTDSTAVYILDGKARVQGVEIGATGKITDKWQVFAGYTYLDTEIVRTRNRAELGRHLPNTPPNSATLWTTYAVTPEFTIGGGLFYQDKAYANTTNMIYVPSWVRFDAMASYQVTKAALLQFNIYNIGDEKYYAQYYGGHAVPAAGRYASLSLKMRW